MPLQSSLFSAPAMSASLPQPQLLSAPQNRSHPQASKAYRQEVDTNIYQVQMACLKDHAEMATGDAEVCPHCFGVFNKYSKVEEVI